MIDHNIRTVPETLGHTQLIFGSRFLSLIHPGIARRRFYNDPLTSQESSVLSQSNLISSLAQATKGAMVVEIAMTIYRQIISTTNLTNYYVYYCGSYTHHRTQGYHNHTSAIQNTVGTSQRPRFLPQ